MTRREWYERVNAAWPAQVPPLTAAEATRALRRLYRFGHGHTLRSKVLVTSGNRYTRRDWVAGNRVWFVNPERGWKDLVHVLSHYAERSGHNGKHARMELRMIKEVVRRGWLDGKLRPRPAPVKDLLALRAARAKAGLARWERKRKLADTKIKSWHKRVRYYDLKLLDRQTAVPTFGT